MGNTARKIWGWVQLALFAALAVLAFPAFRTQLDTSHSMTVSNYSNSIWEENPTDIYFTASESGLTHLWATYVINSDAALASDLSVTLRSAATGEVLLERTLAGQELADGRIINFVPGREVERGEQLVFAMTCDAAYEDAGFRILIGPELLGDIDYWTYNGITDTELMPGLHIVYDHFGTKTLLAYLALAAVALAATWLPKSKFHPKARGWLSAGLFLAAPLAAYLLCQAAGLAPFQLTRGLLLTNYLLIFALQLAAFGLGGSTAAGIGGGFGLMAIFTVVNHYTLLFRGVVLSFADIRVAGTAFNVMAQYKFAVDMQMLFLFAATLTVLSLAIRYNVRLPLQPVLRHSLPLAAGAAALVLCLSPAGQRLNGGFFSALTVNDTAQSMGQPYGFAIGLTKSRLEKPEAYTAENVFSAAQQYMLPGETDGAMPDIVLIMNESFADIGSLTDLDVNTDPLAFLHSLAADSDPRTFVGQLAVPTYGGGTANSEFEALSGLSMRNFTSSAYPYVQYVDQNTPSFARFAKAMGYEASALHPGAINSYNRQAAYTQLDFDRLMFAAHFTHSEMIRNYHSDKSCYDEILDLLDAAEAPQFIFNVTIQNHGDWPSDPNAMERTVTLNSTDDYTSLESLLTLYQASDKAFEYFITELEKRERPTLVVMFGDHFPAVDSEILTYLHLDDIFDANPLAKSCAPVVMWANYDVDLSAVPNCFSSNYMPAVLAKLAGLPLSGQQQFLLEMMQALPVYSPAGCYDAAGQPAEPGEAGSLYQQMQYAFLRDADALPEGFALPVTKE